MDDLKDSALGKLEKNLFWNFKKIHINKWIYLLLNVSVCSIADYHMTQTSCNKPVQKNQSAPTHWYGFLTKE